MKLFVNKTLVKNASNIEYSDDLENTADTISFDTDMQIKPGSQFALVDDFNNKTIMMGIVSEYTQNKKNIFSYSGYDFGFYLNHNSIIKQFNGLRISEAIKSLCRDYKIPVGSIPELRATIKKIYKNTTLSDCLKEILDLAKTKMNVDYYYMSCASGKFDIKKYQLISDLKGYLSNAYSILSRDAIHNPNVSVSMEDMKNQVVVVDSSSDKVSRKVIIKNQNSIRQFGLLQHIEEVDKNDKNNFSQIAKNKLEELNKLNITISLSMLGDSRMRKGIILPISNKDFDIDGYFLIKSSKHSVKDNKEIVSVNLEKYDTSKLK